jgi:hypothetical protein
MANESERRLILEMVESGKITPADGLRLLQALGSGDEPEDEDEFVEMLPSSEPQTSQDEAQPPGAPAEDPGFAGQEGAEYRAPAEEVQNLRTSLPPDIEKWRRWWMIPMWAGVGMTILGGLLMFWAQQAAGIGFWFMCAWVPFLLGVFAIVLAWQSRTARWLHLRVYQKPGDWPQKIAISFPLPIRLTAWFLRVFRDKIPGLQSTSVDELILALENSATPDHPLFVEVDEGEDGERVQVFIG